MVQRSIKGYKPPEYIKAAGYYKVKWDGLDEMRMRGLIWVGRSVGRMGSSVSGRMCETVFVWRE